MSQRRYHEDVTDLEDIVIRANRWNTTWTIRTGYGMPLGCRPQGAGRKFCSFVHVHCCTPCAWNSARHSWHSLFIVPESMNEVMQWCFWVTERCEGLAGEGLESPQRSLILVEEEQHMGPGAEGDVIAILPGEVILQLSLQLGYRPEKEQPLPPRRSQELSVQTSGQALRSLSLYSSLSCRLVSPLYLSLLPPSFGGSSLEPVAEHSFSYDIVNSTSPVNCFSQCLFHYTVHYVWGV